MKKEKSCFWTDLCSLLVKKNKSGRLFQSIRVFLLFFPMLMLDSCDLLNNPIESYLEKYTDAVSVETVSFQEDYPTDSDDVISVPSTEDCTIVYELNNPQLYTVDSALTFADGITGTVDTDYTVVQDDTTNYITLVLKESFLTAHRQGTDIDPTITLTETFSGRSFNSYTTSFRCNSVPTKVSDATVMLYTSADTSYYLLCFNLPDTLGPEEIDNDVKTLTIKDESESDEKDYTMDGYTISGDSSISTSYSSDAITVNPVSEASFYAGTYPVYFETGVEESTDSHVFDITLTDAKGLSSLISIDSNSFKLSTVSAVGESTELTAGNTDITEIVVDKDTASYTITAPDTDTKSQTVSDVTVHYSVTDNKTDSTYETGSDTGSVSFDLPHNDTDGFTITAWATKSGYINSDKTVYKVSTMPSVFYVSQTGSDDNYGSSDAPYASVSFAAAQCTSDTINSDTGYSIYVDGNISCTDVTAISSGQYITLTGETGSDTDVLDGSESSQLLNIASGGSVTIDGLTLQNGNSSSDGGGIYNAGTLTLTDSIVTGCTASGNGSGIYNAGSLTMSGSSVVDAEGDDANDVYLADGTVITLDSLTGTDTVAEITPEVTDDGTTILESSSVLDYTVTGRFILNVDDRCLVLSADELSAVIGKLSISVTIEGMPSTEMSLTAVYDADTNTATVTVENDSTDISEELTSWTITVLDSSNRETGVTSTGTTGTAPNVTLALVSESQLADGTYNLLVVFTYNDITYSASYTITKSSTGGSET